MNDARYELKVGDQVHIVRLPTEFVTYLDEDLEAVYRNLMVAETVLTIDAIDMYGKPWVSWEEGKEGGEWSCHSLALNDDSWECWNDPGKDRVCA